MRRSLRRSLALAGGLLFSLSTVNAWHHDKYDGTSESRLDRFVQRTPQPSHGLVRGPFDRTMHTAGYPQNVHQHAVPSVGAHYHAGYIGGGKLLHNNIIHGRGAGAVTGPTQDGVFGTDWTGFREHMGRVFLRASEDPSKGHVWIRGYSAEGPRVTDVFAIRPLRKAVLEKREDMEKREHGEEGHGGGHGEGGHGAEGGHGGEAGHGPEKKEGGAKKEGGHQ